MKRKSKEYNKVKRWIYIIWHLSFYFPSEKSQVNVIWNCPDFWWLYREIRVPEFLMANKLIVLVEINWDSLAVSYLFVCFFPAFILGENPRSWKCHAVWEGDSLFSLIKPLLSSHFCDVNLRVCFVEGKK